MTDPFIGEKMELHSYLHPSNQLKIAITITALFHSICSTHSSASILFISSFELVSHASRTGSLKSGALPRKTLRARLSVILSDMATLRRAVQLTSQLIWPSRQRLYLSNYSMLHRAESGFSFILTLRAKTQNIKLQSITMQSSLFVSYSFSLSLSLSLSVSCHCLSLLYRHLFLTLFTIYLSPSLSCCGPQPIFFTALVHQLVERFTFCPVTTLKVQRPSGMVAIFIK